MVHEHTIPLKKEQNVFYNAVKKSLKKVVPWSSYKADKWKKPEALFHLPQDEGETGQNPLCFDLGFFYSSLQLDIRHLKNKDKNSDKDYKK